MQKKQLLLWLMIALGSYGIFMFGWVKSVHEASAKSVALAKERFFKSRLDDTIYRIEGIYKDSCRRDFYVKNYSMYDFVVNVCEYPVLKQIERQARICKDSNSVDCNFINNTGDKIDIALQIEY